MNKTNAAAALALCLLAAPVLAQQSAMTFFVTSANPGKGADPGGLAGADRYCQQLASAVVGHHDRMGLDTSPPALSWNSSHASRGCSVEALRTTGGAGYFYCFAAN
jgi:hypothetical protein